MLLYCLQTVVTHWISRNLIWLLIYFRTSRQKQHFPALIYTISLFHFVLGLPRGYLFIIKFSLNTWKESTLHVYIYIIVVSDASLFLLVFVSTSPLTSWFQIFCLVRFILILWSCLVYPYFCWLYQGQESDVLYYRTLLSFIFLGPDDISSDLMKCVGSAGLKYRSKIGHGHLPCFSQWTLLFHLHVPVVYKFWGPQPLGAVRTCPGLYKENFTLTFTLFLLSTSWKSRKHVNPNLISFLLFAGPFQST